MNKLLFAVLLILVFCSTKAFSQLSDRVNSPSTFKVGTRPVMGNYGLFFGIAYNELEYWFDHDVEYNGLPIVNIKYYKTDKTVWRIGFQTSTTTEVTSGKIDTKINGGTLTEKKVIDNSSRFTFYPGIEHHYTSSNILDVYMGYLIPIGWDRERYVDDEANGSTAYNNYSRTRTSLTYGFEAFVGVQAFIADLPLALGIDFGAAAMGHLFDKYKYKIASKAGGLTTDQTFYTEDDSGLGIRYESLNKRDFQLQGNVRLTITYFFKN